MLLLTALEAYSTREFVQHAARANGVVVALNAGAAHPEIEFTSASGEKISFPAGGFISFRKGQRAAVLYRREDPYRGPRLDHFGQLWAPLIISASLALMGILLGARVLRRNEPSSGSEPCS